MTQTEEELFGQDAEQPLLPETGDTATTEGEAPQTEAVPTAQPAQPTPHELDYLLQRPVQAPTATEIVAQARDVSYLAKLMHVSRLAPPDLQNQGEAAITIIMMKGLELNIPPVLAVQMLHIIKGRIAMAARLMRALFLQRCPGAKLTIVSSSDTACTLRAWRNGQDVIEETFDISEAKRAGLVRDGSGWVKWPKDMCYERCTSRIARRYWPDILMGCGYTPEEIEQAVPADRPAANPDAPQVGTRAERQVAPANDDPIFAEGGHQPTSAEAKATFDALTAKYKAKHPENTVEHFKQWCRDELGDEPDWTFGQVRRLTEKLT